MTEMTPFEIEQYIEKNYYKVKTLLDVVGMTKEQWIEKAIQGPEKLFTRCENCKKWPCEAIENLKEVYPLVIKCWYEHGCNCSQFGPKVKTNV